MSDWISNSGLCLPKLTHSELTSFLVLFILSLCDVVIVLFGFFSLSCWTGCCVSISAEYRGLVQGGRWDSHGKEIQQRPVWRYIEYLIGFAFWATRTDLLVITLQSSKNGIAIMLKNEADSRLLVWYVNSIIHCSGLIGSLFSLLQFLSSPITGALSDKYGRRPLLILTTVSIMPNLLIVYYISVDFRIKIFSEGTM